MADQFAQMGFEKVRVLSGGVDGWKKAGYPLAAETSEQPGHQPSA